MSAFCVLINQIKEKIKRIADVIECHPPKKCDLDQSFQTDGAQVILNYIRIVEVKKNGMESEVEIERNEWQKWSKVEGLERYKSIRRPMYPQYNQKDNIFDKLFTIASNYIFIGIWLL